MWIYCVACGTMATFALIAVVIGKKGEEIEIHQCENCGAQRQDTTT